MSSAPCQRSASGTCGRLSGEVGEDEQLGSAVASDERVDMFVVGEQHAEVAVGDGGLGMAQLDKPPVVVEYESSSASSACALISLWLGLNAIHGVASVKPALSVSSHCIGVRALSRLRTRSASRTVSGRRVSLEMKLMTSMRKPSTPRSSHQR